MIWRGNESSSRYSRSLVGVGVKIYFIYLFKDGRPGKTQLWTLPAEGGRLGPVNVGPVLYHKANDPGVRL